MKHLAKLFSWSFLDVPTKRLGLAWLVWVGLVWVVLVWVVLVVAQWEDPRDLHTGTTPQLRYITSLVPEGFLGRASM